MHCPKCNKFTDNRVRFTDKKRIPFITRRRLICNVCGTSYYTYEMNQITYGRLTTNSKLLGDVLFLFKKLWEERNYSRVSC